MEKLPTFKKTVIILWGKKVYIETTNPGGNTVLSIIGRIDTSTATELEQAINKEIGLGIAVPSGATSREPLAETNLVS